MKQINECLNRFFEGRNPLKRKWQAVWKDDNKEVVVMFHYHHLILAYNIKTNEVEYQWWEVQADKRGLDAALKYFKEKQNGER